MVIVETSIDDLLEKIDFQRMLWYDLLTPSSFEDCPSEKCWIPPFEFENIPSDKSDLPNYSDLWSQFMLNKYNNRLDEIIDRINQKRNIWHKNKKTGGAIIAFALENAFYHGNQNNPNLLVSLKYLEGKKGAVIRIRDSGNGFDYSKVLERRNAIKTNNLSLCSPEKIPTNKRYFKRRGRGFNLFSFQKEKISFDKEGTCINLCYDY